MTDPHHCAEAGHPCFGLYVVYCQHIGQWSVNWHEGTADEPTDISARRYGPFDGRSEVLDDVIHVVTTSLPLPPG